MKKTIRSVLRLAWALLLVPAAAAAAGHVADKPQRQEALEHYRAGQAHMRAEAWAEAEREFKTAIKLDPLLTLAHYGLGQTYMYTRRYPDAVGAFTACNDAYGQLAALQLTDSVLADQRRDEEIRELRNTIRAYESGQIKSAQAQNAVLRLESRLQELERQRQRGPSTAEVPAEFSLALGSAYFRSEKLADAEREYGAALKVNPKLGEAYNNLAVVYLLTGRFDEAEKAVGRAEKAGFKVNPQLKKDIEARKALR